MSKYPTIPRGARTSAVQGILAMTGLLGTQGRSLPMSPPPPGNLAASAEPWRRLCHVSKAAVLLEWLEDKGCLAIA